MSSRQIKELQNLSMHATTAKLKAPIVIKEPSVIYNVNYRNVEQKNRREQKNSIHESINTNTNIQVNINNIDSSVKDIENSKNTNIGNNMKLVNTETESKFNDINNENIDISIDQPSTALIYDPLCTLHIGNVNHPERPARVMEIMKVLKDSGLYDRCKHIDSRRVTREELLTTHSEEHIFNIEDGNKKANELIIEPIVTDNNIVNAEDSSISSSESENENLPKDNSTNIPPSDPYYFYPKDLMQDTYYNRHSLLAAELSVGGLINLAEDIMDNKFKNGVAVIRPPGHHAECHKMMGFCLFNNVAVAANVIKNKYNSKILIVDWDVHHGNGTQNIFYTSKDILYFSIHRSDDGAFYPGTGMVDEFGEKEGLGFNVNVPLPGPYLGDAEYVSAWDKVLIPIAKEFNPDLIFISAGFDAALGDPLGKMEVTPACYAYMTKSLMDVSNGKVIVALEGGYNCTAISESMKMCVHSLLGDTVSAPDLSEPEISRILNRSKPFYTDAKKLIAKVVSSQCKYWSCLDELALAMKNMTFTSRSRRSDNKNKEQI